MILLINRLALCGAIILSAGESVTVASRSSYVTFVPISTINSFLFSPCVPGKLITGATVSTNSTSLVPTDVFPALSYAVYVIL